MVRFRSLSHFGRGLLLAGIAGGGLLLSAVEADANSALSIVTHDPAQASSDWPSSGHDWSNTGHNAAEATIGVDNVSSLEVVWRAAGASPELAAPVIGTVVTADGVAYYADSAGFVHARRLHDGAFVWSRLVSTAPPDVVFESVFLSAPVLSDDSVYVGDSGATIYRVDRATGAVLWSTDVDPHPDALIHGDPQLIDGQLIVGVSSFENADALADDLAMRGSVVSLDVRDGSINWQSWTTSDQSLPAPKFGAGVGVWSSPAIDPRSGRIYIGTGQHYEPGSPRPSGRSRADEDLSDSLLKLSLGTGRVQSLQFTKGDIWGASHPGGLDYDVGAPPNLFAISSPKSGQQIEVVGVGDKSGTYYVIERRSMRVVWSRQVAQGSVVGGVQATAAYADGVVYVAAHEAIRGEALTGSIPAGESASYLATPEGVVLMQRLSRTNIMALDASTGVVLWQTSTPGAITVAPLILANGVLYQGDLNGAIRAFDARSGAQLLQAQLGGIADGSDYSYGNFITAMSISEGRLLVSSVPLVPGAPAGVTAYGLPE